MKYSIIASLIIAGITATSCGKLTIQVKKDAKNSTLQSTPESADGGSGNNFNLANPENFLKEIDGLRTNAASIIIKQLASQDYVGKFRTGIRKYRAFIVEKANQTTVLSDSFYTDASQQCRDNGLSLNIDKDNELLGMILQTALLAKLGEADVGKLNSGLSKDLQALSQFITMELGVEINGTSGVDKDESSDISRGQVTIKLVPIEGEAIDEATKTADANSVMTLNFERRLAADEVGTFHADIRVDSPNGSPANALFDISRAKDGDHYIHIAAVKMGTLNQTPNYARQIQVSDVAGEKLKFNFTDVLNVGKETEKSYKTVVDVQKGTQCKVVAADPSTDPGKTPTEPAPQPVPAPAPGVVIPPQTPTQTPSQTPTQSPTKK